MSNKFTPVIPTILSAQTCKMLEPHGLTLQRNVTLARNLRFRAPVYFFDQSLIMGTQIDSYSYIGRNSVASGTSIGRYCSIAHYVDLAMGIHNIKRFSTTPALYNNMFFMKYSGEIKEQDPDYIQRGMYSKTTIGNDVWIGADVKIPASVTIGHSAVIGTGTVITKDVPPYAVVVGRGGVSQSQQIVKYRFSDEIISDLLEINWWDYDLPRMVAQGIKVPRDNVQDLISFFKNEEREKLIPIDAQWRLLCCTAPDTVHLFPTEPDTFMEHNIVEVDARTGQAVALHLAF